MHVSRVITGVAAAELGAMGVCALVMGLVAWVAVHAAVGLRWWGIPASELVCPVVVMLVHPGYVDDRGWVACLVGEGDGDVAGGVNTVADEVDGLVAVFVPEVDVEDEVLAVCVSRAVLAVSCCGGSQDNGRACVSLSGRYLLDRQGLAGLEVGDY